jgi:two-component system sensor histidine kinase KdpD
MKTQKIYGSFSIGKQYFFSTVILFIFIMFLYFIQNDIGYHAVSLILLLIIFLLPLFNFDMGPIILAAIISALAWDYYFIPPHFTMYIASINDVITLCMFFIVALTNGVLTARLKSQRNEMIKEEKRFSALYKIVKSLASAKSLNDVLEKSIKQVHDIFGFQSVVFLPEEGNKLKKVPHPASNFSPDEMEWLAAETAFKERNEAGKTTSAMSNAEAKYFPLESNGSVLCVIGVRINTKQKPEFLKDFIREITPFVEKFLG